MTWLLINTSYLFLSEISFLQPFLSCQPVIICTATGLCGSGGDDDDVDSSSDGAKAQRQAALKAVGADVLVCRADENGRVDLADMMTRLHAHTSFRHVMVEGGAGIISSLIGSHLDLVDQLIVTIAPVIVGGVRAVQGGLVRCRSNQEDKKAEGGDGCDGFPRLKNVHTANYGSDIVMRGDV